MLRAGSSIRAPDRSPRPRSRQLALLDVLQPSRSSAPATRSEPPAGSLNLKSRQLAGPGCSAASRILAAGHTVRDVREPAGFPTPAAWSGAPRQISKAQEQAARQPWVCCSFPDPRHRPRGQRRQGALRISDTCSTVRAPGRSPKPRSGKLAGPGCAVAFRIFGAGRTARDAREPQEAAQALESCPEE